MKKHKNSPKVFFQRRQDKGIKKEYAKELFEILRVKPISRRMAATKAGFPDQTYMVTQFIYDWRKQGIAQVVGTIKCSRSHRFVEAVTTNPDLFVKSNQMELFDYESSKDC